MIILIAFQEGIWLIYWIVSGGYGRINKGVDVFTKEEPFNDRPYSAMVSSSGISAMVLNFFFVGELSVGE